MKFICPVCARQVIPNSNESTEYTAPGIHPKRGFNANELYCDECSLLLDENGMFEEEHQYD